MQINWTTEHPVKDLPPTITLDVENDFESLRLWILWDDLTPSIRRKLLEQAENEHVKLCGFSNRGTVGTLD